MILHPMRLIKIIGDKSISGEIENLFNDLGLQGYTILDVKGLRLGKSQSAHNVQIEVITSELNAVKIAQTVRDKFFHDYDVIVYMSDVKVIRQDKFL